MRAVPLVAAASLALLSVLVWRATQDASLASRLGELAQQAQYLPDLLSEVWLAIGFPCH
jgi:hypothetical protein